MKACWRVNGVGPSQKSRSAVRDSPVGSGHYLKAESPCLIVIVHSGLHFQVSCVVPILLDISNL